ncbi:hypothetical protein ES703_78557 [subsurface metagenome]
MIRKQAGQALILVLIVLAIGAVLVVPSLRLTSTALMGTPTVERQTKGLYAADAATEYILWKLAYDEWGKDFDSEHPEAFLNFYVCEVPVSVYVAMRATEGKGGITLATDDKIKPTKTVEPSLHKYDYQTYTYTISLDYISDINEENPQVYLDAIYDIPPGGFGSGAYDEEYGCWLSLDGGDNWQEVPDPLWDHAKGYLKWPADYDKDTGEGAFSSHAEFLGIENFEVREVKMLRFKMYGRLADDNVHCNWVVLKMDDEEHPNTLSGPQAPITVGRDEPGECLGEQQIAVTKESNPQIIQPGVPTFVDYTISITSLYTPSRSITEITDYVPPGFEYVELISSEMEDPSGEIQVLEILELDPLAPDEPERSNPLNDISLIDKNGVVRSQLRWRPQKFPLGNDISIASGQTLRLTFRALATKDVSGSYYNEVVVLLKETGIPGSAFEAAGVLPSEFGSNYSWLTGTVFVPAYDTSSEAGGITINTNMALILEGITITSWGLAMVWLVGWRRGRQLYQRFYDEELSKLEKELEQAVTETVEKTVEETIEERVQKALRERWK